MKKITLQNIIIKETKLIYPKDFNKYSEKRTKKLNLSEEKDNNIGLKTYKQLNEKENNEKESLFKNEIANSNQNNNENNNEKIKNNEILEKKNEIILNNKNEEEEKNNNNENQKDINEGYQSSLKNILNNNSLLKKDY